jgi:hypothetical protein
MSQVTDDAGTFVAEPRQIQLIDGTLFKLPPCSWGTELKLIKLLGDVFAKAWQGGLFGGTPMTDTLDPQMAVINLLFTESPDKLTKAASAITRQPEEWVQDNLDSDGILQVVLPFLQSRLRKIVEAVGKQIATMQAQVVPAAAVASDPSVQ